MSTEYKQLESIYKSLENKKADDIKIIDISEVSSFANYFVIADGSNQKQVQAMADEVENNLKPLFDEEHKIEGYRKANWILLDYMDIVVHIFDHESRDFYKLENIWKDGKIVMLEDLN